MSKALVSLVDSIVGSIRVDCGSRGDQRQVKGVSKEKLGICRPLASAAIAGAL